MHIQADVGNTSADPVDERRRLILLVARQQQLIDALITGTVPAAQL